MWRPFVVHLRCFELGQWRIFGLLEAAHQIGYSGGMFPPLRRKFGKSSDCLPVWTSLRPVDLSRLPINQDFTFITFYISKSHSLLFNLFKQTLIHVCFPPPGCRMPCGCSMLTIASRMTLKTSTGFGSQSWGWWNIMGKGMVSRCKVLLR